MFSLRRPGNLLLVLLFAGVVAYIVERLVVTDIEAVEMVVAEATEACRRGDFDALREHLSEDFEYLDGSSRPHDREASVRAVRVAFGLFRPIGLATRLNDVAVTGETATARATVSASGGRFEVRLSLRREDGRWRLTGATSDLEPGRRVRR
jgi:hypothetical protein